MFWNGVDGVVLLPLFNVVCSREKIIIRYFPLKPMPSSLSRSCRGVEAIQSIPRAPFVSGFDD